MPQNKNNVAQEHLFTHYRVLKEHTPTSTNPHIRGPNSSELDYLADRFGPTLPAYQAGFRSATSSVVRFRIAVDLVGRAGFNCSLPNLGLATGRGGVDVCTVSR
jgi:hypothetical protein